MEVIRIKKILAQNLPIGICLHWVRTLSWFVPTMSTLTSTNQCAAGLTLWLVKSRPIFYQTFFDLLWVSQKLGTIKLFKNNNPKVTLTKVYFPILYIIKSKKQKYSDDSRHWKMALKTKRCLVFINRGASRDVLTVFVCRPKIQHKITTNSQIYEKFVCWKESDIES